MGHAWRCRYIPNRRLQFEYPDNYAAAQREDCMQDSNMLARPEALCDAAAPQLRGSSQEQQAAECGRDF
jgi:hypothetical protein